VISLWPGPQRPLCALTLGLFEKAIKLAGSGVFLELLIPRSLISLYKKSSQGGQFLRRQLGGCLFDLRQAHGGIVSYGLDVRNSAGAGGHRPPL
jgi:hypothetical protein